MKNLLIKLKIIEEFDVKVPLTKKELDQKLQAKVQQGGLSMFKMFSEAFSGDPRQFIGKVQVNDFHIKLKQRLFTFNRGIATAKGTIKKSNDKLSVHAVINGLHTTLKVISFCFALIYLVGILFICTVGFQKGDVSIGLALLGLLIHAVFIYGIIYLLARVGAKKLKEEIIALLN